MDFSNIHIEYIVVFIVIFALSIFFTRWVFRVDAIEASLQKQQEELQKQTRLLSEIAEKQGVLKEVIEAIRK
jgi:membrane protein implicated in regulation of membrane protease activity